jgi:hypothetical protein
MHERVDQCRHGTDRRERERADATEKEARLRVVGTTPATSALATRYVRPNDVAIIAGRRATIAETETRTERIPRPSSDPFTIASPRVRRAMPPIKDSKTMRKSAM